MTETDKNNPQLYHRLKNTPSAAVDRNFRSPLLITTKAKIHEDPCFLISPLLIQLPN